MVPLMVTSAELEKAKATVLEAAREQPGPSLSERELLQLVLNLANGQTPEGPLLYAPGLRLIPSPHGAPVLTPSSLETIGGVREKLREDLVGAMGPGLPVARFEQLKTLAAAMVAVPTYDIQKGRTRLLHVRWRYMPTSLESILAYAVLLLRDESEGRKFGDDLKRCKLDSCQIFFFSSDRSEPTGKPRESYCTREHMLEAHRQTSTERVRRWRAKHK